MATPTQMQASGAVLVVALLLSAPAYAAIVIGEGGKPVPRAPAPNPSVGEQQDGACKGLRDKRTFAFNLAPQTKLVDAVAWIASVVCKPFLLPGTLATENKTLTLAAPARVTPAQAYRLFLDALDSVGLTVERAGPLERITEIGAAPPRPAETGGVEAPTAEPDPYVSVLLRLKDLTPEERARVERFMQPPPGELGDPVVFPPDNDTVIITDLRSKIERLLNRPIGR